MSRSRRKISGVLVNLFLIGSVAFLGYIIFLQFQSKARIKPEGIRPLEEGFYSHGIDVSHYQAEIDWDSVLESNDSVLSFVFCKATEGTTIVDQRWKSNLRNLRKRKIPVGAYHFFKPKISASLQAKHFLNQYTPKEDDLPPVLDVEEEGSTKQELIENVKTWLNKVESYTGRRPIIYTNYNMYIEFFQSGFNEYKFWIANYSYNIDRVKDNRIFYWQYSDKGKIPGIKGFVDLNMSKVKF